MKILIVTLFACFLEVAAGLSLEELNASFISKQLKIEASREASLDELRVGYGASLSKMEAKLQQAGRLDDILLVQGEAGLIARKTWPLPPLKKDSPSALIASRKIFDREVLEREIAAATKVVSAADLMARLLAQKTVSLTKAGNLEEAQRVKALAVKIEKDPRILESRRIAGRVSAGKIGPVAKRIRRGGDHVEVLVRLDRRGQVSMESTIENAVEVTDKSGELGITSARVLGEFVGAKGYEVDPWIMLDYRDVLNDGKAHLSSITIGDRKKIEGETGSRISLILPAKNAFITFPGKLPPTQAPGVYRLTCDYFLPESNTGITGFGFHQGYLAPIGGSEFGAKGKWTSVVVDQPSLNDHEVFRFYFKFRESPSRPNANDFVGLKNLKLEHRVFSAFVVEDYDQDGAIASSTLKAAEQKVFITAGKLLSN